jgi:hypothetical protein
MNIKKSLDNRIRGWFPQEPALKMTLKARMTTVNRSTSFKVRRWLHGFSAFMHSLIGHISLRTKLNVLAFGIGIFTIELLYFLTIRHLVSGSVNHWGGQIAVAIYFLFIIADSFYYYFKKKRDPK